MSESEQEIASAVKRVRHYLANLERVSGLDQELVHSLHSIPDGEPGMLLASDLRMLTDCAGQIAELGASNASLIRRVADIESQLAEAKNRTEEQRIAVGVFADGMKRRQAELELLRPVEQAARAYRKASDALQNFDGRKDNLGDLADAHVAAREAIATALDAYDAAGNGETAQEPWATNDVYTVHCPTCGRKASAYCVNTQGREVYPAHAARYRRLTEPMDVPIDDTPQAGKGETNDATANLAVTSRGLADESECSCPEVWAGTHRTGSRNLSPNCARHGEGTQWWVDFWATQAALGSPRQRAEKLRHERLTADSGTGQTGGED